MKLLYIGIQSPGTTSLLRGQAFRELFPNCAWHSIDTDEMFRSQPRWVRSLAFRMRIGPAVNAVNKQIRSKVPADSNFDVVWIDKAVYLWPKTVQYLRERAKVLIHYTPDAAFFQNRSRYFERTLSLYDRLVTTKSFELDEYQKRATSFRVSLVPQSFDSRQHRPVVSFEEKQSEAVLIGLCERDREKCVATLLSHKIRVAVGGNGWDRFCRRNEHDPNFRFLGTRVFGTDYTEAISSAIVGLGLVTKRFPELHTTRTFEIPACGTAVATEANAETTQFFEKDEAIFFKDHQDLAKQLSFLFDNRDMLKHITKSGRARVCSGKFDNTSMVRKILSEAGVQTPERTEL